MDELLWADATAQSEAIRAGEVRAADLVGAYLDRIERFDPWLRAYVTVDGDRALDAARRFDERPRGGWSPLAGVALSVKDVEDVAGLPTTQSCEVLADRVAEAGGPVARRLRDGGLVPLGKTNVPELCSDMTVSRLNGVCRNPWDPGRTPGGSSGGAATALAAGLCAIAHGTDGAGSVRVPAAWCGLVGLKPSRGLVSFGPDEGSPYFQLTVPGVLARAVRDTAAMLDLLAAPGPWTPRRDRPFVDEVDPPEVTLRIAVTTTPPYGDLDPECARPAEEVARLLEGLGHAVETRTPAWEIALAGMGPLDVPGAAADIPLEEVERLEPRNRATLTQLASMTVVDHHRWVETARRATQQFLAFWETCDVLITPTAGMLPPPVEWAAWDDDPVAHMTRFASFPNFAQPFNITGQPAITLPLGWSASGLPIGVQLVGRPLEEATLLRLAAQLEQAAPWATRTADAARTLAAPD